MSAVIEDSLTWRDEALAFAPIPIPDEHIYSFMARWFRLSGYQSRKDFMRLSVGLDCRLLSSSAFGRFDLKTQHVYLANRKEVLDNATLFPYHRTYLPVEPCNRIELASYEAESQIASRRWWRLMDRSLVLSTENLRYCPKCARFQAEKYGFTAWLRVHNLPMVEACVLHRMKLRSLNSRNSPVAFDNPTDCAERFFHPPLNPIDDEVADRAEQAFAERSVDVLRAGSLRDISGDCVNKYWQKFLKKECKYAFFGVNEITKFVIRTFRANAKKLPPTVARYLEPSYVRIEIEKIFSDSRLPMSPLFKPMSPLFNIALATVFFGKVNMYDFLACDDLLKPDHSIRI